MRIGFCGTLFIVFLVLKLTEVIDWSWWWVTSPLWGGIVLLALLFIVPMIMIVTCEGFKTLKNTLKKK